MTTRDLEDENARLRRALRSVRKNIPEGCLTAFDIINTALSPPSASEQEREWRCFHCDECFTTKEAALEHFGPHELADPACQIDIGRFREMETYFERCQAEDSDSDRQFYAMRADHAQALKREEEKGFERGLKTQLEKISRDKQCPYCERPSASEQSETRKPFKDALAEQDY